MTSGYGARLELTFIERLLTPAMPSILIVPAAISRALLFKGVPPCPRPKGGQMSSNLCSADFRSSEARTLREMLKRAGYVTSRMGPLDGPEYGTSHALLVRFRSGILSEGDA